MYLEFSILHLPLFALTSSTVMPKEPDSIEKKIASLQKFLAQNPKVSMAELDLQSVEQVDALAWKGFSKQKSEILTQLKGYQRLSKIDTKQPPTVLLHLLREGIHSALQIASMPLPTFLLRHTAPFDGDKQRAEAYYHRAEAVRSRIVIQYMAIKQGHEPHFRSTKGSQVS